MQLTIQSKGYQVTLNTLGAELNSYLSPSGKEYVWNSDPTYWLRSSPLLFPTIGNLRNGTTLIGGEKYEMARHGFCKESEFQVVEHSEDKLVFLLESNEETLKSYPFRFQLYLTYTVNGSSLTMDYKVVNLDDKKMYYHIGAHPGFMLPIGEGESIKDCILEFEKEEEFVSYEYDLEHMEFNADRKVTQKAEGKVLPLNNAMFEQDAIFFENTNSHEVSFVNKHSGCGVTMKYPDFVSIAFWTVIGSPFLCLEPWNGSATFHQDTENFEEKRGILSLEPGKEKTYHLEIILKES